MRWKWWMLFPSTSARLWHSLPWHPPEQRAGWRRGWQGGLKSSLGPEGCGGSTKPLGGKWYSQGLTVGPMLSHVSIEDLRDRIGMHPQGIHRQYRTRWPSEFCSHLSPAGIRVSFLTFFPMRKSPLPQIDYILPGISIQDMWDHQPKISSVGKLSPIPRVSKTDIQQSVLALIVYFTALSQKLDILIIIFGGFQQLWGILIQWTRAVLQPRDISRVFLHHTLPVSFISIGETIRSLPPPELARHSQVYC